MALGPYPTFVSNWGTITLLIWLKYQIVMTKPSDQLSIWLMKSLCLKMMFISFNWSKCITPFDVPHPCTYSLHSIYFCTQSLTSPWQMLSVFLTTLNKAYCIVLYCIVLYYIVLYCIVLYCICRIKTGHSNPESCFGPRMRALAKVFYRGESRGKIPCQRPNPRAKTWHKIWMTGLNPNYDTTAIHSLKNSQNKCQKASFTYDHRRHLILPLQPVHALPTVNARTCC